MNPRFNGSLVNELKLADSQQTTGCLERGIVSSRVTLLLRSTEIIHCSIICFYIMGFYSDFLYLNDIDYKNSKSIIINCYS